MFLALMAGWASSRVSFRSGSAHPLAGQARIVTAMIRGEISIRTEAPLEGWIDRMCNLVLQSTDSCAPGLHAGQGSVSHHTTHAEMLESQRNSMLPEPSIVKLPPFGICQRGRTHRKMEDRQWAVVSSRWSAPLVWY